MEHVGVQPLQHARSAVGLHQVGVIHIAVAQRLHCLHAALALEGFGNGDQGLLARYRQGTMQGLGSTWQRTITRTELQGQSSDRRPMARSAADGTAFEIFSLLPFDLPAQLVTDVIR